MITNQILARLKRWPAVTMGVLLAILAALWIDSCFHERHFIFLPGGDVGLGFASHGGRLHWVEYAPWERRPETVYWSKAAVPNPYLTTPVAALLFWYVFRKYRTRV